MATRIPAKSNLRQKKTPKAPPSEKAQAEKDKQNLSLALHHANLIQTQNEISDHILNSIITLLDYPPAAQPAPQAARTFVSLIKLFQPSDYESLIEERRIDGKCGYALCAQPPRCVSLGPSAAWKVRTKSGRDFCSNHCAKKAFVVKAQLNEVPAWERAPEQQPEILIHEDDRPPDDETLARRAARTERVEKWRRKVGDDDELAMERGEKAGSLRPKQVMSDVVVEKRVADVKPMPVIGAGVLGWDLIEGYQTKRLGKGKGIDESNDEDFDDGDD